MAKVYVGYLYQSGPGAKKVHNCYAYNGYKGVEPVSSDELAYGMVLYKKIPFRKNVVREVITGKKIPVIAEGASSLTGVHTFIKFNGTMYKKAKLATDQDFKMYATAHQDRDKFLSELEALFKKGKENVTTKRRAAKKEKKSKKKRNKDSSKVFAEGNYAKEYAGIVTKKEEEQYEASSRGKRTTSAETSGLGKSPITGTPGMGPGMIPGNARMGGPGHHPGGPMGPGGFDPVMGMASDSQIGGIFGKAAPDLKSSATSAEEIDELGVRQKVEKKVQETTTQSKPEVDELGTPIKAQKLVQDTPVASAEKVESVITPTNVVSNENLSKKVTISSVDKTEGQVVKDLVQVAERGDVGIATLQGVDLSTKFLKSERDLTEYFLYKRYGQTPTSPSVLAVIELENSMTLLNGEDTKGNTRSM